MDRHFDCEMSRIFVLAPIWSWDEEGLGMENVGIFFGHLAYLFMTIWNNL
jgi:hypothetical protein